MTATLLALALALADPNGFPTDLPRKGTATSTSTGTPISPPTSTPTATATSTATPAPALTLPTGQIGLETIILPIAALAALALAALFALRRKRQAPRLVQVLESTSLGPKRNLVVARVGDELLVLGSSEAGLQLLAARPLQAEAGLAAQPSAPARLRPVPDPAPERSGAAQLGAERPTGRLRSLLGRLRPRPAAPAPLAAELAGFEALLAESAEDQELRRKLAQGQAGSVR
jgi:flagellar biogenesis protein FliO